MQKSIAYQKAYAFAIRIIKCVQHLREEHKEYTLTTQLLRSGTSIGANLAEANAAISTPDFSNKISLAYKECKETIFWIDLLKDTDYLSKKAHQSLYLDAEELSKILYAILKTTRINPQKSSCK